MSSMRHIAVAVATLGLAACDTPPAADPPRPGNVMVDDENPGHGVIAGAPGSYDTAAVAAPGELVMHLRWKSPGATLATAIGFSNLPASTVTAHTKDLVMAALDEAVGNSVNAERMAPLVNIDAPIDMVGVADTKRSRQVPEPMFAWSVGLTSIEAALQTSRSKPAELQSGVWRLGSDERMGSSCAIAASAGKTPARLVCVEDDRYLETMATYMARNIAALPSASSDMHAEIKLRGLLDKYGRTWANQARGLPIIAEEFKLGIPKADQAMLDAAEALAKEAGALIHDADSISADITLDAQKGITVSTELAFAGSQSWTVQTITDGASLASAPPDLFWRVPERSEMVSWSRSGDPARFEPIFATVREILDGVMAKENIGTAADRKAITELLRGVSPKHTVFVASNGHFDAPNKTQGSFKDLLDATVGWHIVGVEQPADEIRKYLNSLVQLYNRPTLQGLMKKEMGSDAKHLPKVSVVPAPRGFGAGSLGIKIAVSQIEDPMEAYDVLAAPPLDGSPPPPPRKPVLIDVEAHLLLLADGNRTWIGFSFDRDRLAAMMEATKGDKPGASTLANRSSLSRLKDARHNALAVTTLNGFVGALKPTLWMFMMKGPGLQQPGEQILEALEKMPHKGETPVVFTADVTAGSKPKVKMSARVPKETLVDLGHLVSRGIDIAKQAVP